jgi:cytochrome c oxidase subunit III
MESPAIPASFTEGTRRLEPAKLGLLLFIAVEIMFFAGILSAFVVFRFSPVAWPPPGQPRLPLALTTFNTFVLLFSGFTLQLAYRALKAGKYAAFLRGLEAAVWSGFLFLAVQGSEWVRLIRYGLNLSSGAYGGFFYLLVGMHALHVAGGLAALFWIKNRASRGTYAGGNSLEVELCRMYWFFVVGLWPVLFVSLYL